MPLARIHLRRGKPPAYRKALCDGVYRALRDTFNVPENDRFLIVSEHDADHFVHADNYLGIAYSDTRNIETRQALFARVVALLTENPGLRNEDIFINLVECKTENWPFGNGIAQYVATTS
jgi:4-oxalocrotonate tautomerase